MLIKNWWVVLHLTSAVCAQSTRANRIFFINQNVVQCFMCSRSLITAIKCFDDLPRWSLNLSGRVLITGGTNSPLFASSGKWQTHSFTLRLFYDHAHTLRSCSSLTYCFHISCKPTCRFDSLFSLSCISCQLRISRP